MSPKSAKDPRSASRSQSEQSESAVKCHVLIVEDNESDVFLIERAIAGTRLCVSLHVVKDGQQAIQFLDEARDQAEAGKPCPDLVILDINLPKKQGGDVLKHLRDISRCAQARVIVVSSSDASRDREQMAELGADAYFRKPSDLDEFMKLGDLIKTILGGGSE